MINVSVIHALSPLTESSGLQPEMGMVGEEQSAKCRLGSLPSVLYVWFCRLVLYHAII